jgi:hypothetical protein
MQLAKRCVNCGKPNPRFPVTLCALCHTRKAEAVKKYLYTVKLEAIEAYGGAFCACCLEDEILFLGLDHIENDGAIENVSGHHLYSYLRKYGFPPGFRVLCHNCNLGRYLNGGTCPHASK